MTVLSILSCILILSVLLSRVRNDFWIFRILEYPRLQKLYLLLLVAAAWAVYWPPQQRFHQIVAGAVALCVGYLLFKILPYTIASRKELKTVPAGDATNELKIFAANVYQDNRDYEKMLAQIRACDPDLVLLLETDPAWERGVKPLEEIYPHCLTAPLNNTYGLLFYSRFQLQNGNIRYLVKQDIPSIEATVVLPSGQPVHLWGVHPEPPVPGENLYATAKDKELMQVALKAKACKMPCVVFGDLNDVAWSHTTELFRKTSGLLDPRRGRGFYSTFSAHHWWVRFPLDYIFCSEHFGLVEMKRLPKNGSDHFATFTHLRFQPALKAAQKKKEPASDEWSEAQQKAAQPLK